MDGSICFCNKVVANDDLEGDPVIPKGLAVPNTPPFMIITDNMAFFNYSLIAHFFCMNGIQ